MNESESTSSQPRAWFFRELLAWALALFFLGVSIYALWPESMPPPPATEAYNRDAFIRDTRGAFLVAWQAGEDPSAADANGDVVWSTTLQLGFARIQGLAANQPDEQQYQLWIFDEKRGHPVNGGVFDIPPGEEETVIRIDPELRVFRPTRFVVTAERPGGVVVSEQDRVVLTGKVPLPEDNADVAADDDDSDEATSSSPAR